MNLHEDIERIKEVMGINESALSSIKRRMEELPRHIRSMYKWLNPKAFYDFDEFIEMDADMSHRLRDLRKMLEVKGADLIIGSRWITGGGIENWSKGRQFLSKLANRYVQFALKLGVNDATSGFRVYQSSLLEKISLDSMRSDGYAFQIEMTRAARKAGAKIVEVPITFRERVSGSSKMSKRIVLEAIFLVTIWGLKRLIKVK